MMDSEESSVPWRRIERSAAPTAGGTLRGSSSPSSSSSSPSLSSSSSTGGAMSPLDPQAKLRDLVKRIKGSDGFVVKTRRVRMRAYPSTFVGSDAVTWLIMNARSICRDREVAQELCQQFLEEGIFHPVVDRDKPFLDANVLYRFADYQEREREEVTGAAGDQIEPDLLLPYTKDSKGFEAFTTLFRDKGPELKERKYKTKLCSACFVGEEAVDWMMKFMRDNERTFKFASAEEQVQWKRALNRTGCQQALQYMCDLRLFKRPTEKKEFLFKDGPTCFIFINPDDFKISLMLHDTQCQRVGQAKYKLGFRPKYPVIIVPGLASSVLECWQSPDKKWQGTRIWIDIGKLGQAAQMQQVKLKFSSSKKVDEDKSEVERRELLGRKWTKHILPLEDGYSDPPGIKIRAAEGLHGVDYLATGVTRKSTYVWGHVIKALIDVGYDTTNLMAAPYDWRIPPSKLEERDGYFTKLRFMMEQSLELNKERAVLVGHSMGNRNLQYFFAWIIERLGKEWLDKHVHGWLGLGAPLLGATKAFRGVMTGDALGLQFFLVLSEGRQLAQNLGSLPWLRPILQEQFTDPIARVRDKNIYLARNPDDLCATYCPKPNAMWENYYVNDPYFLKQNSGDALPPVLRPPPIQNMYFIYGINLETEVTYYLAPLNKKGLPEEMRLDEAADRYSLTEDKENNPCAYRIKKGIGYELPTTRQPRYGNITRSGDGTVPYCSLAYCRQWKEQLKETSQKIEFKEVEGADHRMMMREDCILNAVIDYVCEQA